MVFWYSTSRTGKPVRCMLDRDEDMLSTGTRHPFLVKYKVIDHGQTMVILLYYYYISQQQLRNSGMSHLWSFVKQHHLTVLNLDLKPIFLRSIFIACNLVYFILTVMYFRFLLNI